MCWGPITSRQPEIDSSQAGGFGVLQTAQQRKWTWSAPPCHHTAVAPGRHLFISYQKIGKKRREVRERDEGKKGKKKREARTIF